MGHVGRRRCWVGWATVAVAALGVSCATPHRRTAPTRPRPVAPVPAPIENVDSDDDVQALVDAHNVERSQRRLEPLRFNPALGEAATLHAQDMARRGKMSHTGGDRSSPFDRMTRAGYRFTRAGENVAAGQTSVAEVMRDWMHSPGHRRNILGAFREIGVARVTGADGTSYWCATFGRADGA